MVWVDRDGNEELAGLVESGYLRLSPDGTRVAFTSGGEVWMFDLARRIPSPVTDMGGVTFILWHPDGERVVFTSAISGTWELFITSADGTGTTEQLPVEGAIAFSPEGWTADGRLVLSYQTLDSDGFHIGILSSEDGAIEPFLATPDSEDSLAVSPDGRWIAYESDRDGQYEVYVEKFPERGSRQAISAPGGGRDPIWSLDGTELFYRRYDDAMMAATITETNSILSPGVSHKLFDDI
jgi:TolB protein